MVIIASSSSSPKSSLHHLQAFNSQNNNSSSNHLRDASFSSYLNTNNDEDSFAESSQNFIRKEPLLQGVDKEDDGEIGVFGAEKYFNGLGEVVSPTPPNQLQYHFQKDEQRSPEASGKYYNKVIKYGTPSVRSESSWNSKSALLQNSMKDCSSRNKNNKMQQRRKSFLAGLGCKYCSCSDKNSVDVSDNHSGEVISFIKTPSSTKKHLNADLDANNHHHSVKMTKPQKAEFLISNNNNNNNNNKDVVYFQKQEKLSRESSFASFSNVKIQLQEAEKQRKSLEVFGSPILESRIKSLSFDKRLTTMPPPWDSAPAPAPKVDGEEIDDDDGDGESEASSDLFEIESLTGNSNSNPSFLARPRHDSSSAAADAPGCASPTNCYAPSEASIEWSVVTASALEYSAISDFEDQRTIRSPIRPTSNIKPAKASKEIHRRRPNLLLGCKSQKAVGVALDAFATCEKPSSNNSRQQIRRRPESFAQFGQVTRFQAETKDGNFGVRHVHQQHQGYIPAPPPALQRSHSPHASQLLYI